MFIELFCPELLNKSKKNETTIYTDEYRRKFIHEHWSEYVKCLKLGIPFEVK